MSLKKNMMRAVEALHTYDRSEIHIEHSAYCIALRHLIREFQAYHVALETERQRVIRLAFDMCENMRRGDHAVPRIEEAADLMIAYRRYRAIEEGEEE